MKSLKKVKIFFLSKKIKNYFNKGDLDQAHQEIKKLDDPEKTVALVILAELYAQLFEVEKALDIVKPLSLPMPVNLNLEGKIQFILSTAHLWLNEFDQANQIIRDWEVHYDQIKDQFSKQVLIWNCNISYVKGTLKIRQGKFQHALDQLHSSLKIAEELGGKIHISLRKFQLGIAYFFLGNLELAQQTSVESIEYAKAINNDLLITGPLWVLALIDASKGLLDSAIDKAKQSIEGLKNAGVHPRAISLPLHLLGKLYHQKGNLFRAQQLLIESKNILEKIGDEEGIELSRILFDLIHLSFDLKLADEAKEYVNQLNILSMKAGNPQINLRHQLAEAYLLKQNKRLHKRMESYDLFNDIITQDVEEYDLIIFAILNLCELLILEIHSTGEAEPIKELEKLINQLIELGTKNQIYHLVVEARLFQAKVSLITGDIKQVNLLLDLARKTAKFANLLHLQGRIDQQQEALNQEINKWVSLVDKHSEDLEIFNLQSYLTALNSLIAQNPSKYFLPASNIHKKVGN